MAHAPGHVSEYNAGTEGTLEAARAAAKERAAAIGRDIGIYEHVGGYHPKKGKVVQPSGQFMWRDLTDDEGRELGVPKFVWREAARVTP